MGENYPHEFLKLFSQSVRGCAIIHVGFLSVGFDTPYYTGFTEGKPLLFQETAYFTASAEQRGILAAMAQSVWRRPVRISRIPAESDKAPELQQEDKTAQYSTKTHYSAIILQHLESHNEKWGKSSGMPGVQG